MNLAPKNSAVSSLVLCWLLAASCGTEPAFDIVEKNPEYRSGQERGNNEPSNERGRLEVMPPSEERGESEEVHVPGNGEEKSEPTENPSTNPTPELPPKVEESIQKFVQNDRTKLDILWVIDNSGSMSEIQSLIRQNFRMFAEYMKDVSVDFQMGVTTTDVCTGVRQSVELETCPNYQGNPGLQGKLVQRNGKSLTGSSSPNLIEEFSSLSNVGISGSSFEHGLSAAKLAISRSIQSGPAGLKRPGSFLAVMVVSDEEDDGVGLSRADERGINFWESGKTRYFYDANAFAADLKTMLPDGRFSLNAIVGTRSSNGSLCSYRTGNKVVNALEEGLEYQKAADLTGGLKESICDSSWSSKFRRMAENIDNQLRSFRLDHPALVSSLKVWVNGAINSEWTFDQTQNAVLFDDLKTPPPGSIIEIRYLPKR